MHRSPSPPPRPPPSPKPSRFAITQRDKFLRINGLVRGDLARDDPGIADLTALTDAHPALGARVRHRFGH